MSAILDQLEKLYLMREEEVERWLSHHRAAAAPPVTCSVDLRHSGVRLVPVDNNLYPAGFNNLSAAASMRAARFFQGFMQEHYPQAKRVLIVPENHTRNLAYLDSLVVLQQLLIRAGMEVQVGSLVAEPGSSLQLTSLSGHLVEEMPLVRSGNRVAGENGFTPDVILLNNDCTSGPVSLLEGITQPVFPPMWMGWYQRRKSAHFEIYRKVVEDFAAHFGLDPWLLAAGFRQCGEIDFKAQEGLDMLARSVDEILAATRSKYAKYGIKEEPYVFVKADGGTYGMGIMVVHSGEEILHLNKKERNKMQVVKEGARVSEVIIQEGVPTVDTVNGASAEPMMYLIDGIPAGGMFRANAQRDQFTNLNAAGMTFTGMCDETETQTNARQPVRACHFRAFGLVAAISALAAGKEIHMMQLQEAA